MDGGQFNSTTIPPFECPNSTETTQMVWTTYIIYRVIIDVFVVGFLCLVGFVGNALSIAILYRDHDRKNTTNWLLQTLALVDTLYLIACVFIQPIKTIHDHTDWMPSLKWTFPYIYPYVWVGASVAQTITVWMVMLVTIDRYIAICHPLKNHLRSVERAKVAVLFIILASICYNIPRIFERELDHKFDPCTNLTMPYSNKSPLWSNKAYFLIYKTIMYFIFRAIGPLLVLILLNMRLINALHLMRKKHKDITSKTNKNRENITLMLVAVVSVFIVCMIPDLVLRIFLTLSNYIPGLTFDIMRLRYANSITNMLLTVNSSINFLIYCLIGKKFRTLLQQMCGMNSRPSRNKPAGDVSETEPLTNKTTYVAECKEMGVTKAGDGQSVNGKCKDADVCL